MCCAKMAINDKFVRTVSTGTQHGWSKLVELVGSHVQGEACARSGPAKGASAGSENQKKRSNY